MSWDITIQDLPDFASIEGIPDDFEPKPIGSREDVIRRIKAIEPNADFSDPSWGILEGDGWSIEINAGDDEVCDSVMLHVRGNGDAPEAVHRITQALGVRALDHAAGELFSLDRSRQSFAEWRRYRDGIGTHSPAGNLKAEAFSNASLV